MSTLYGLWIDHSHAFLMKANNEDVLTCEQINSDVEPRHHGGVNAEHLSITNQNKDEERRHNQMHHFCKTLMERLKDADEIVVFGPGNAKLEFKNALEKNHALSGKLTTVETTDKLTENQMKATTRKLLQLPREV
jgi:UDP-N-acetylmuramate-alanine ligase